MRRWIGLLLLVCAGQAGAAEKANDAALCRQAISASERAGGLPAKLLDAIGVVESGRPDGRGGAIAAWPWTINVAGSGHFFTTEAEAIAAVEAAQLAGIQSIDVGCFQINLLHHPHAFANLQEAFDPAANARYATGFLQRLYHQTSSWSAAAVAYHSFTPERAAEYGNRLAAAWPLASAYGLERHAGVAATPLVPAKTAVDPHHVFTPEFRDALIKAEAFRRARDAAMGIGQPAASTALAPMAGRLGRAAHAGRGKATLRASLD